MFKELLCPISFENLLDFWHEGYHFSHRIRPNTEYRMAAAKEDLDSRHVIQCGNCMEVDGYLWNPVVLPCGHEFCEKCLRDHHPNMKIITCFICK